MRIELTVRGPNGDRDVVVDAAAATPFAAIASQLLAAAGVPGGETVPPTWSGEQRLRPTARLGDPELRTGRLLTLHGPDRSVVRPGVLSLHVVGGPDAGRVLALQRGRLRLGRAPGCDLVMRDDRVSRVHAEIDVGGAITVRDLGSTNGTRIDTDRVSEAPTVMRVGQLIALGDSLIELRGPAETPAASTSHDGTVHINRAPRAVVPVVPALIARPADPAPQRPQRTQWITAMLPAVAGGAIAWLTHSPQFLLFALLSPVMVLSGAVGDRLHWRRSRRRAARRSLQRRAELAAETSAALADETAARRRSAPDPAGVWRTATGPGARLWERRRTDDDHLVLRVGTGDQPSAAQLQDGTDRHVAGTLHAVPVCVDVRAGPIGLSGPADAVAGLARWLIAQLATLHSPADVDLALFLSPARSTLWSWARWLPHVGGRVATDQDEWPVLLESIVAAVEHRRAARGAGTGLWKGSWIVLILDPAGDVADLAGLDALLHSGTSLGVAAVCLDTDVHALPPSCTQLVQIGGDTGTGAIVQRGSGHLDAVADRVSQTWAEQLARALAPLADASDGAASLPTSCGLLTVLGLGHADAADIDARWAASDGRAGTVLGRSAGGVVAVDLLTHGPHTLIAGTTGAGKSELLRTLVTGLAIGHPPEHVTFLLIDYKGGAAFAACAALPHTAGLVTDLDPYLARRALRSLDAELLRRESVLAAAGASDFEIYRRLGATPLLARLVIVVDEFAALAEDVPEFVGGMVSVAQRGRSLGLHLVLATQRPGAAVTADIRANTSLRIALRVTDAGESVRVIDATDAATIDRTTPGRAYLRAGGELICFQTASAHEPAQSPTPTVEALLAWRRPKPGPQVSTEPEVLARTVATLAATALATGRPAARSPWLPPLPRYIDLCSLPTPASNSVVPIGLLDLPDAQAQPVFELDAARGESLLVAGRSGSGRTTALVTIALAAAQNFAPDRLEVYVADPAGPLVDALGALPHVVTALGPPGIAMTPTLLRRLHAVAAERASARTPARDHPRLLVLIDSWDTLLAGFDDLDAARCVEGLDALLRVGAGAGLTVALAGGRGMLLPRMAAGFGTRLLLDLHDRADYGLAGVAPRSVPDDLPPGRGVRAGDGVEFHLAVADAETSVRIGNRWPASGPRAGAVQLRPLPTVVRLGDLPQAGRRMRLGLAGDAAVAVSIDPFSGAGRILVAGPPRSGRTNVLRVLLAEAVSLDVPIVVAAPARSLLAGDATRLGIEILGTSTATPIVPTLLLVDDCDTFTDTDLDDQLCEWAKSDSPVALVVAGRTDDLATTYRGIGAQVRRSRCGVLLRPGPLDGELLGVRLPRRPGGGPPGRGVVVGEPCWGPPFDTGEPITIQVARP